MKKMIKKQREEYIMTSKGGFDMTVPTLHESVEGIDKEFRDLTLKYSNGTALALLKLAIMSREVDIKKKEVDIKKKEAGIKKKAVEVYEDDKRGLY